MKDYKIPNIECNSKLQLTPDDGVRTRKVAEKDEVTATIQLSSNCILFGKHAQMAMNMENRFIKFYYDAVNKVVAWRIETSVTQSQLSLGWKLCKPNKVGQMVFAISNVLNNFTFKEGTKSLKKLVIKKHKDYSLLDPHTYYCVEINKTVHGK